MTGKQTWNRDIPKLLVSLDVTVGKECNPRESEILVVDEHLHWGQIGLTQVVDETGYIAIRSGINAKCFAILWRERSIMKHCSFTYKKMY